MTSGAEPSPCHPVTLPETLPAPSPLRRSRPPSLCSPRQPRLSRPRPLSPGGPEGRPLTWPQTTSPWSPPLPPIRSSQTAAHPCMPRRMQTHPAAARDCAYTLCFLSSLPSRQRRFFHDRSLAMTSSSPPPHRRRHARHGGAAKHVPPALGAHTRRHAQLPPRALDAYRPLEGGQVGVPRLHRPPKRHIRGRVLVAPIHARRGGEAPDGGGGGDHGGGGALKEAPAAGGEEGVAGKEDARGVGGGGDVIEKGTDGVGGRAVGGNGEGAPLEGRGGGERVGDGGGGVDRRAVDGRSREVGRHLGVAARVAAAMGTHPAAARGGGYGGRDSSEAGRGSETQQGRGQRAWSHPATGTRAQGKAWPPSWCTPHPTLTSSKRKPGPPLP